MNVGKFYFLSVIILLASLVGYSFLYHEIPKTSGRIEHVRFVDDNSLPFPLSNVQAAKGESQQNISTNLNSALQQTIVLGKGTPFSMAFDPATSILYIVSPSETGDKIQNMIYVIDTNKNQISDTIKIGDAKRDFLRDIAVDPASGTLYVTGEYRIVKSGIVYEYDSAYVINPKTKVYKRISLYSEPEEGKEGDLSGIAVDEKANKVYVGSLYPEGGNPGIYVINPNKANATGIIKSWESGVKDLLVNPNSHEIVAAAKYDNLISIVNGSTTQVTKNITVNDPIAISADPSGDSIFAASGSEEMVMLNLSTGKNTSTSVGPYIQDISFNPFSNIVYAVSTNKSMHFSPDSSNSVSRLAAVDPKTGVIRHVYEIQDGLSKVESNPSTGAVYILGYDDSHAKLFILKPEKNN